MTTRLRFFALFLAFLSLACLVSQAQTKKKIAVFPFDDRTAANHTMNIGTKVSDALISKLAGTGDFEIVDREYLNRLMAEKNLKFDPDFNPAGAAKTGLLGVVDIVVVGQIDSFNANVTSSQTNYFVATKSKQTGVTGLKVTARLISVERGTILSAPSATSELTGLLAQSTSTDLVQGVGSGSKTANTHSALAKLVDQTVDAVSTDLSAKLSAGARAEVVAHSAPSSPKFVGIEDGLIVINKGTGAGIKVGQKFNVTRPTDTGMKDPDTGQAIIRKKKVCSLVISVVEDAISSGSCDGGLPVKGDEIAPVVGQ
jgi:curli biogenesis system outer membrane secretion channel CsgG